MQKEMPSNSELPVNPEKRYQKESFESLIGEVLVPTTRDTIARRFKKIDSVLLDDQGNLKPLTPSIRENLNSVINDLRKTLTEIDINRESYLAAPENTDSEHFESVLQTLEGLLTQYEIIFESGQNNTQPQREIPEAQENKAKLKPSVLIELIKSFEDKNSFGEDLTLKKQVLFNNAHNVLQALSEARRQLEEKKRNVFDLEEITDLTQLDQSIEELDTAIENIQDWWLKEVSGSEKFKKLSETVSRIAEFRMDDSELPKNDPDSNWRNYINVNSQNLQDFLKQLDSEIQSIELDQELQTQLKNPVAESLLLKIGDARVLRNELMKEWVERLKNIDNVVLKSVFLILDKNAYLEKDSESDRFIEKRLLVTDKTIALVEKLLQVVKGGTWQGRAYFQTLSQQQYLSQKEFDESGRVVKIGLIERLEDKLEQMKKDRESINVLGNQAELQNIYINNRAVWDSFFKSSGLLEQNESSVDPEVVRKLEQRLISFLLNIATRSMWDDPGDSGKSGTADFLSWDFRSETGKLTLSQIIDNHPDGSRKDRLVQQIQLLTELLKANISWEKVIKDTYGKTELIEEHLEHFFPDGEMLDHITHLPTISISPEKSESLAYLLREKDKKFGDLLFEATYIYAQWNARYVYLSKETQLSYKNDTKKRVENGIKLRAGKTLGVNEKSYFVPTAQELSDAARQIESGNQITFNNCPLSVDRLLTLYFVESDPTYKVRALKDRSATPNVDYQRFIQLVIQEVSDKRIRAVEEKRQSQFGVFPQAELKQKYGSQEWVKKREQIAIAVGAYRAGIGEYVINPGNNAVAYPGTLKLTQPQFDSQKEFFEKYTTSVEEHADHPFEGFIFRKPTQKLAEDLLYLGKSAEMMGASLYKATGGQILDDGVNAKSPVFAVRLMLTRLYRSNYKEVSGREGVFSRSIDLVEQLLGDPMQFLAADGMGLRKLFGQRDKRMIANYSRLGNRTERKRQYLQMYEWAKNIYQALAQGYQDADLLHISEIERPQGYFSTQEYLKFLDSKLQKLIEFSEKNIKYLVDALVVSKSIRDSDETGIYDKNIYFDIPNTNLCSPLLGNVDHQSRIVNGGMLNLNYDEVMRIAEDSQKLGMSRAIVKVFASAIIVESLMRSGQNFVSIADVQALKWVLAGVRPTLYTTTDQKLSGYRQYHQAFNFSEAEVDYMIKVAGLNMESWITVFAKSLGALK